MFSTSLFPKLAIISFALLAVAIVLVPRQASALGPQCAAPYVKVQDAAPAATDPTMQYSIDYVSVGEPRNVPTPSAPNSTPVPTLTCNGKRITVVLKVPTMDPSGTNTVAKAPPNSTWMVRFDIPGSANSFGTPQTLFLTYDNTINPAGDFFPGWFDPNNGGGGDCSTLYAPPATAKSPVIGTIAPDGTITMSLDFSSTVTFATCAQKPPAGTGVDMTITPAQWATGMQLTNIVGITFVRIGGLLSGVMIAQAQTVGDGTYTIEGNVSCSNPPVAALSADVTSGNAPLTVNFDASASNIPTGGCGTIASYIFDFGDSTSATQATPTIAHTYTTGGATYHARVRVVSTKGITSSNIAGQDITVNTAGPPVLVSVGSRATHGSPGDFDVNLNLPPNSPTNHRGVECRSSASLGAGNYKVVFTFLNNLIGVGSATVTTGTFGTVSGALGPNPNQYTVNLTGVANQQYIGITLLAAHDVTGALGNEPEIAMGVLTGDVNATGLVDGNDVSLVQAQARQTANSTNFRLDVNTTGLIDGNDVSLVQSKTRTSLPSPP